MDSGVLFHKLYVTMTNPQRHKNGMLMVLPFNPSCSFFHRETFSKRQSKTTCVEPKKHKHNWLQKCWKLPSLPKFWGPPKSGALGWSLFSLMVNPRLTTSLTSSTPWDKSLRTLAQNRKMQLYMLITRWVISTVVSYCIIVQFCSCTFSVLQCLFISSSKRC